MIKKMTITRDELQPGDYPIETGDENYIVIYREIPEFGNSAKLHAAEQELAKAKAILSRVNQTAHQYFAQARRLQGLSAPKLAHRARLHGDRILAALRGEELQEWTEPNPAQVRLDMLASAEYWSEWLTTVTGETLTDGTPLLTVVFEQNPQLADRLKKALENK